MPGAGSTRKAPVPAIILAGYTMIVLDISFVITAIPEIHRTLNFSASGNRGCEAAVRWFRQDPPMLSTTHVVARDLDAGVCGQWRRVDDSMPIQGSDI
jgi:hypothetical protein